MLNKLKSRSIDFFLIFIATAASLSIVHNLREYEKSKEEILRLEIRKVKLEIQLLSYENITTTRTSKK